MAARRLDLAGDCLAIEQCADYNQTIQYNAPVSPQTNPPTFIGVDLTGWTVKSQVRAEIGYAVVIELDDYITLNAGAVPGAIAISIPNDITVDYPPGIYKWDLFLTNPSGVSSRLLWGNFEIRAAITQ
jgi:hypothetical protein